MKSIGDHALVTYHVLVIAVICIALAAGIGIGQRDNGRWKENCLRAERIAAESQAVAKRFSEAAKEAQEITQQAGNVALMWEKTATNAIRIAEDWKRAAEAWEALVHHGLTNTFAPLNMEGGIIRPFPGPLTMTNLLFMTNRIVEIPAPNLLD